MHLVTIILQVIVALGILNVWLLRYSKATEWRGGDARNMKEEFAVYGLPEWAVGGVGFLKLLFAAGLLAGIWFPSVVQPAAFGLAALMLGAVAMHFKVKDPIKRALPAFVMLVMSLLVAFMSMAT